MLKKLMKHGNSHALLLNKSVLDLLGLSGGDSVKLTIQGNTLLVNKAENVSESQKLEFKVEAHKQERYIAEEKASKAIQEKMMEVAKQRDSWASEDELYSEFEKQVGGMENIEEGIKEQFFAKAKSVKKLMTNMPVSMEEMMSNEAYLAEWAELGKKRSSMNDEAFKNAALEIRYRHFPELRDFDLALMKDTEE